MAVLRESDASYYMREERGGLILGPYEKGAARLLRRRRAGDLRPGPVPRRPGAADAPCPRRRSPGCRSSPNAASRNIVNGPISYTPDGNPLLGPAYGLKNYWLAEGFSFGITAAGGAGRFLSEWIVGGETVDRHAAGRSRAGSAPTPTRNMPAARTRRRTSTSSIVHYRDGGAPGLPARKRPARAMTGSTRPAAVWGQRYGWERPNWFRARGGRAQGRLLLPPRQTGSSRSATRCGRCASGSA